MSNAMCDGHTASVMRRPERDYLREKGRRTRRQRRAIGKLPDAGEHHRGGVRQVVTGGCGSNQFVKEWREEKREEQNRSRHGRLCILGLVELNLERTSVRVATPVLRGRFLRVVSAGKEIQAGNLFQLAVIARRRPHERQQKNQNCFHEPHTQ